MTEKMCQDMIDILRERGDSRWKQFQDELDAINASAEAGKIDNPYWLHPTTAIEDNPNPQ